MLFIRRVFQYHAAKKFHEKVATQLINGKRIFVFVSECTLVGQFTNKTVSSKQNLFNKRVSSNFEQPNCVHCASEHLSCRKSWVAFTWNIVFVCAGAILARAMRVLAGCVQRKAIESTPDTLNIWNGFEILTLSKARCTRRKCHLEPRHEHSTEHSIQR